MNDLINRQEAINALKEDADWLSSQGSDWQTERLERDVNILQELPSAKPERKEGHWIRKSNWMWTCSCCDKDNTYAYVADDAGEPTVLQDFFCPNCGAKMGGEQE